MSRASVLCLVLQALYKARENEIQSEEHFKAIAERELGRVKDEIQLLEKELATIHERKSDKEVGVTSYSPASVPVLSRERKLSCDLLTFFFFFFDREKTWSTWFE